MHYVSICIERAVGATLTENLARFVIEIATTLSTSALDKQDQRRIICLEAVNMPCLTLWSREN